jgi:hypothetical protein
MNSYIFLGGTLDGSRMVLPGYPVHVASVVKGLPSLFHSGQADFGVPFEKEEYLLVPLQFNNQRFDIYLFSELSPEDIPVMLLSGYRSF